MKSTIALSILLCVASVGASAQVNAWDVPQSTVRSVLQQWAQAIGYGVVWSEGVPDFPTREAHIDADFAEAAVALVTGGAYGSRNLYCPPSVRFPATAYTLTARTDERARIVFVYGVATEQECRPR